MKLAILIGIILGALLLGPILTIWALNTLFKLTIPYTLDTWASVVILGGFLNAKLKPR